MNLLTSPSLRWPFLANVLSHQARRGFASSRGLQKRKMEIRKKSAHPARSTIDGKSPAYKMVYHKAFILYKTLYKFVFILPPFITCLRVKNKKAK
jgi:hypothetical protein